MPTRRDEALKKVRSIGFEPHRWEGTVESCPSSQDPALGSDGALPGLQLARSWRWLASLQPRSESPVHRMARPRRCLLSR